MCAASTNCFTGDQRRAFLFLAHETPGRKSLRMLHSNFKLCPASKFKKKKKKKLHLNTITRVPFLLTAAQKNRMAPIVWKPAAICHIIMSAAALIRNPLGKVSEVASAIASSHTSVLLHIWNFICLLSQHRFLTLIVSSGREVLMCDGRKHEFLTHIHLTTDETGWLKRSGRLSDSKRSNHSQIQQNI